MSKPDESPDFDPLNRQLGGAGPAGTAGEDDALARRIREAVADASTPITVGRLAERLETPDDGVKYADVHEALYRDYLQSLDAKGVLVFDMEVGLVYSTEPVVEASGGRSL